MPIFKKKKPYVYTAGFEKDMRGMLLKLGALEAMREEASKLRTQNQVLTNKVLDLINKLEVKPTTTGTAEPPKKPTDEDYRF